MARKGCLIFLVALVFALTLFYLSARATARERAVVDAARTCLGDQYDANRYAGGPPPRGRGACTDVIYWGYRPVLDLQQAVNQDIAQNERSYPGHPDQDLDYRWCPKLIVWFRRHAVSLPTEVNWSTLSTFRPADVVFFDGGDGVASHVGIVSDRWSLVGLPLLIHNPGPLAVEENALRSNRLLGHFRLPAAPKK
ncbi:MAG: DUF1287 domain-containing protein [Candidatus Eremiobacteraeota bacterium]|nr:DUF1287 domain-containing protein [Candidatus Eremiobacteraeota bacterium]MCW5871486.1 DUF1287 domain-containing protein [Candidatus Eremiobacteraeota bacterium]